jgi:hypothetical protein
MSGTIVETSRRVAIGRELIGWEECNRAVGRLEPFPFTAPIALFHLIAERRPRSIDRHKGQDAHQCLLLALGELAAMRSLGLAPAGLDLRAGPIHFLLPQSPLGGSFNRLHRRAPYFTRHCLVFAVVGVSR